MKFIEKDGDYICSACGQYSLADKNYIKYILNCPICGEKYERNRIDTFRGIYYFLSNFYEAPVEYKGLTYCNSEAAYQAQKAENELIRYDFTILPAGKAKRLGRAIAVRSDWDDIKEQEMFDIVLAKFTQNKELQDALVATGDAILEESNTWGDKFWGTVNGVGENHLGKILMDVRTYFQCVREARGRERRDNGVQV